jgi:hypothetical protein
VREVARATGGIEDADGPEAIEERSKEPHGLRIGADSTVSSGRSNLGRSASGSVNTARRIRSGSEGSGASRSSRVTPLQVGELQGLGGLALFAAPGPIPPLGLYPLRRHVQPHDAFVDLGDRRWWQVELGRQEAAGYGQKDLARAHDRSERRFVAVLDEPAWLDVGEPERASWGLVAPTGDRRARRRAPSPERSMRHRRHPSPRARRGCRVVGQSQIPGRL